MFFTLIYQVFDSLPKIVEQIVGAVSISTIEALRQLLELLGQLLAEVLGQLFAQLFEDCFNYLKYAQLLDQLLAQL